ncbi:GNAT family N-acetyltransferase [Agromyces endophyticus]|uniref:GNAT family N-acetyltransferase n=1 Tax=Agromyces sp. H17E-10 TaxID=2932244 RepID=UPI001FD5941D|nr:GNAT family N-acetyltransferase [Agromyces sp. H17E-10]UOQ90854.1 GNAT family N-acetyltransferase [Agromyces sp. H17E-10]
MTRRTARLLLDETVEADLEPLHEIYGDPRTWEHLPSGRHASIDDTQAVLDRWLADWRDAGFGAWTVRTLADPATVIGHGGCAIRGATTPTGSFWNLGYRFRPEAHGHGYATELSLTAIDEARARRPELPVVAYLLEHNLASARVAEKVGLELRHRAPDAGNPDPAAIRLVYADRALTDAQLAATLA